MAAAQAADRSGRPGKDRQSRAGRPGGHTRLWWQRRGERHLFAEHHHQGNATEKEVRGALAMTLPELERMIAASCTTGSAARMFSVFATLGTCFLLRGFSPSGLDVQQGAAFAEHALFSRAPRLQ